MLKDSILVQRNFSVAILLNSQIGTVFEQNSKPELYKAICLYNLPKIDGNFLMFECHNPVCQYYFKVHLGHYRNMNKISYWYPRSLH